MRRLFFPFVLLIIVYYSVSILYSAYYSYVDYDMGKVLSYLELYPGFISYLEHLKFGLGIGVQVYALEQFMDPSVQLLKILSWLFFVLAFFFTLLQLVTWRDFTRNQALAVVLAAASTGIFFTSHVLQYLGSYGMLVYCQAMFFGAALLYFCRKYLWNEVPFDCRQAALWVPVFLLATLFDIRVSFYLCVAFITAITLGVYNRKEVKKILIFAIILGLLLLAPLAAHTYIFDSLTFRPHGLGNLAFRGNFNFGELVNYLCQNSLMLVQSLVGQNKFNGIAFVFFSLWGVLSGIKTNTGRGLALFIVICILTFSLASLWDIYPYGSIRYATVLFPFLLYCYLLGVFKFVGFILKNNPWPVLTGVMFLLITVALLVSSYTRLEKDIRVSKDRYQREKVVISKLLNYPDSAVWCDVAAEKIAMGNGQKCKTLGGWNFVSGKPEKEAFYEKLSEDIGMAGNEIVFHMFRPIEKSFFEPQQKIMDSHGYKIQSEFHGASHLYILIKN